MLSDLSLLDTLISPCNDLASAICTLTLHLCSCVDMGRRPLLSYIERTHALGYFSRVCQTQRDATIFGLAISTISWLWLKCHKFSVNDR